MATEQMNLRIDSELKSQADALYEQIGLTTAEAIRMFLKQSVLMGALPLHTNPVALRAAALPEMQLSEEGRKRFLAYLENPSAFQGAFAKHQAEYEEFAKKHNIRTGNVD